MFIYLTGQGKHWLRGILAVALGWLVLGLLAPAAAIASEWSQSGVNNQAFQSETFGPWLKDKPGEKAMKWSGSWGAFNTTVSEKIGGSCALDSKGQEALDKLLSGIELDAQVIMGNKDKGMSGYKTDKDLADRFQEAVRGRLGMSGGKTFSNEDKLSSTQAKSIRPLFNNDNIKKMDSPDQLNVMVANSPSLTYCTKLNDVSKQLDRNYTPDFITLFKDPAQFIARTVLFPFAWTFTQGYRLVGQPALGFLLNTPHSERGDTLLDSSTYGSNKSGYNGVKTGSLVPLGSKKASVPPDFTEKSCAGAEKLGFNCKNRSDDVQKSKPWIGAANGLRSVLSAVYGIIVVGVSIMYLVRRNAQSQYHLKVIMPRLFFAILLSTAAPYLIGTAISISNFLLQALLETNTNGNISQSIYNTIMSTQHLNWNGSSGMSLAGASGIVFSLVLPVLELGFVTVIMVYFLALAFAKQIILIILILMTPFACISFVFRDSGRNLLALWAKGIIGVCLLPLGVAGCLVLGMQVGNMFNDQQALTSASGGGDWFGSNSDQGWVPLVRKLLALMSINVALFMSMRVVSKIRQWVTGNKVGMMGRMAGKAVQASSLAVGGAATALGSPMAGALAASATSAVGQRMRTGSKGNLLPQSSGTFKTPSPGGGSSTMMDSLTRNYRVMQERGDEKPDKPDPEDTQASAAPRLGSGGAGASDPGSTGGPSGSEASVDTSPAPGGANTSVSAPSGPAAPPATRRGRAWASAKGKAGAVASKAKTVGRKTGAFVANRGVTAGAVGTAVGVATLPATLPAVLGGGALVGGAFYARSKWKKYTSEGNDVFDAAGATVGKAQSKMKDLSHKQRSDSERADARAARRGSLGSQ